MFPPDMYVLLVLIFTVARSNAIYVDMYVNLGNVNLKVNQKKMSQKYKGQPAWH
jgi:hypothetical protein